MSEGMGQIPPVPPPRRSAFRFAGRLKYVGYEAIGRMDMLRIQMYALHQELRGERLALREEAKELARRIERSYTLRTFSAVETIERWKYPFVDGLTLRLATVEWNAPAGLSAEATAAASFNYILEGAKVWALRLSNQEMNLMMELPARDPTRRVLREALSIYEEAIRLLEAIDVERDLGQ